jgi:hypothetical protein
MIAKKNQKQLLWNKQGNSSFMSQGQIVFDLI